MTNRTIKMVNAGLAPLAASQISGDFQGGLTAAGTTQATALGVYTDNVIVTTCAAGAGVILQGPSFGQGDSVFCQNLGANALLVYPPVGGQINALALNAGFSVPAGKSVLLVSTGNGNFGTLLSA